MTEKYAGYLEDLQLTEADLSGKMILDLGAGARVFAFDSLENGSTVVSLDSSQLNNWLSLRHKRLPDWLKVDDNSVIAPAERLPFGDNSFDLVLVRSVLTGQADVEIAFIETARVLKPGGIAKVYPVFMEHWDLDEKRNALMGIVRLVQEWNVLIEFWPITYKTTGNNGVAMSVVKLK